VNQEQQTLHNKSLTEKWEESVFDLETGSAQRVNDVISFIKNISTRTKNNNTPTMSLMDAWCSEREDGAGLT